MEHSKQIAYNTIGNIVTLFFQWLIIMLIPKITNFTEAGIFTIAISICSILNHFSTFSLKEHHIADQHTYFTDSDYSIVRGITIIISFILIIPISLLFHYDIIQISVIVGYMIYRNFLHFAYIYSASLQISNHLEYVGKCTALEGILSFISFMCIYPTTHSLPLAVFGMAIIGGGIFLISQLIGYKKFVPLEIRKKNLNPKKVRQLLIIGLPLLCSILAPTIITAMPKLILQQIDGETIAGIFGTLSTPTIIIPTLAISIFAPFITDFSDLARNNNIKKLRQNYLKICAGLLSLGILCVLASLCIQNYIFDLLYGAEIAPYSYLFAYLVLGITVYSIGTVGTTVLITKNQGIAAAISSGIALLFSVISSYTLISNSGIQGATLSLVLAYIVFGILISLCVYILPISNKAMMNETD